MRSETLVSWSAMVGRGLTRFDLFERRVCALINRGARPQPVRKFFAIVSRLGDGIFWYSLMAMLALSQGEAGRLAATQMALAAIVGVALYKLLKARLVRERPFMVHPGILAGTAPLDRYSFPSGHTLHAVMFTTLAIAWFPLLAAVLVPFALLVAVSRMVLGLHYPTDVVVGALIGWGLAELALMLLPPTL
ncbi:MAG: phosphatase PAP2 family protein [Wenzhouxiangellaceae bacterium]|nr:phosphatase PAP2 family protein [Wenzhouxiangellaceae bacterium]